MLRCNRWIYYFGALFQSMACAGAIFGWVNMAYMLQKEGVFSSLCASTTTTNDGCKEQTLAFNTVYSTASVFAFVVPLGAGSFLDRYGPRLTIRILSSLFALGVILLLVSGYTRSETLLYPAFILLGSSASSNILPLYSVSNLFPQRKSLALSILSGAFDSGAIVFLIMARMYDMKIPFSTLILSYLCGPVLILLLLAAFLWPDKVFTEHDLHNTTRSFHNIPTITPKKDVSPLPDESIPSVSVELQPTRSAVGSTTTLQISTETIPSSSKSPKALKNGSRSSHPSSTLEPMDALELRIPSAVDLKRIPSNSSVHSQSSSSSSSPSKTAKQSSSRTLSKSNSKGDILNIPNHLNVDTDNHQHPSDEEEDTTKPHTPLFRSSSFRSTTNNSSYTNAGGTGDGVSSNESSLHDGPQSPMPRTKSNLSVSHHPSIGEIPKTTLVNTMKKNENNNNNNDNDNNSHRHTITEIDSHDNDHSNDDEHVSTNTTTASIAQRYLPGIDTDRISKLSLVQQICTPEYIVYVIFFTLMIIRFQFYIGTINTQLDVLGQVDAEYGKLFGYILPCGAISVFLIGWILDTYGPIVGMFSLIVLAIALSILNLIPVLPLQPLTFLLFGFFRGFLFCNMSVYLSTVFGYKYLGTLIGLLTTIAGLLGLLQQPLLLWAYFQTDPNEPNFYPPNVLMLLLMVLGISWPMWLAYRAGLGSLWNVLRWRGRKM